MHRSGDPEFKRLSDEAVEEAKGALREDVRAEKARMVGLIERKDERQLERDRNEWVRRRPGR